VKTLKKGDRVEESRGNVKREELTDQSVSSMVNGKSYCVYGNTDEVISAPSAAPSGNDLGAKDNWTCEKGALRA
jgi:hypothetical protein